MNKVGIEVEEMFYYFCKDNTRAELKKQNFIILYQSLENKATIVEINNLYNFLDDTKSGFITLNKWEDKLNMVRLEQETHINVKPDELKLFYKVKLFLADLYLTLVRKSFKSNQMYHFFDRNSNGKISYD